jgi:hypothetical protein
VRTGAVDRVIGALTELSADRETRGPLVASVDRFGVLEVRIPPKGILGSPDAFFSALRDGLREVEARAVGLVLPVRRLWGEDRVCDYLDCEALVIAAVEETGPGLVGAGVRCPLHRLPNGWEDALDDVDLIVASLGAALADRPHEEREAL